jgi:threonine/homoserine/homoserine lactone efflux protein
MSTAFLLTSLIIVATPGTGVLYTIAAGLARGSQRRVGTPEIVQPDRR